MSYYRRPMGDYKTYGYAGDPGFLSSLWKGIKKVAPMVLGGILGGPIGGAVMTQVGKPSPPAPPQFPLQPFLPSPTGTMVPGMGRLPPFTAAGPGVLPGGGRPTGLVPSGYHFAKDGSGKLVRNRRMNVANPRALRRSLRRTSGFVKLAKRALKGTGYAVRRA